GGISHASTSGGSTDERWGKIENRKSKISRFKVPMRMHKQVEALLNRLMAHLTPALSRPARWAGRRGRPPFFFILFSLCCAPGLLAQAPGLAGADSSTDSLQVIAIQGTNWWVAPTG